MQKFLHLIFILLLGYITLYAATNTNDKARLKPKPGNVVVVFRPDSDADSSPMHATSTGGSTGNSSSGSNTSNGRGRATTDNNAWYEQQGNESGAHTPQFTITAYPNPTSDRLYIELPQNEEVFITLFSLAGQQIGYYAVGSESRFEIDVTQLSAGMYLLLVQDGANRWAQKIGVVR